MRGKILLVIVSIGVTASPAMQQAPPFSERTEVQGSAAFVREDWIVQDSHPSAFVRMTPNGLFVQGGTIPPDPPNPVAYIQHQRDFNPASGKTAYAKFRVTFDHPEDGLMAFGFFSEPPTNNPFDPANPPAVSAYFMSEPFGPDVNQEGRLFAVHKSSSSFLVTKEPIPRTAGDPVYIVGETPRAYDFVVEIVGTARVDYWYKRATETMWNSFTVTTNIPDAPVRFSAAHKREGTDVTNLLLRVYELEEVE